MGGFISKKIKKNKKKDITEIISSLIHALFREAPFYAEIMTRLRFVESKEVSVAGTDGITVYYNSKSLNKLSEGECNYIILHEMFHVLLLHCIRDAGRDHSVWNIASDCIANSFVDDMAWRIGNHRVPCKRPLAGCFLEDADQYSVEELYDLLMSDQEKLQKMMLKFSGRQKDLIVRSENQVVIKQFVEQLMDGAMPWSDDSDYNMRRLLDTWKKNKKLPWKQLLKKMWMKQENEDSSYLTPERKYLHMELIVSGWGMQESENLPSIWAFIDVSGSISDDEFSNFISQLVVISKELEAKLNIAYWHTEVSDVYTGVEESKNIEKCIPRHCGGTDASCIYKYLKENRIKPNVMLIFTDGYFDRVPDDVVGKLKKKTIVVLVGNGIEAHCNLGKEARL